MTLTELVEQYLSSRDVCPEYAQGVHWKARQFARWLGNKEVSSLSEDSLNRFLRSLKDARSPSTVRNYRGDLLVLWRYAADCGLVPYPQVRRVVRPSVPQTVPECWTTDEVRQLLEVVAKLPGELRNGVRRNIYWQAAIRVGYETGLRRSDIWRVALSAVSTTNVLFSVAHKTGHREVHQLTQRTADLLRHIGRQMPLDWPYNQRHFGVAFEKIVRKTLIRRGTFKWLRRASGSYVEAAEPGAGPRHLGHSSPAVFARFYDARLAAAEGVRLAQPPPL